MTDPIERFRKHVENARLEYDQLCRELPDANVFPSAYPTITDCEAILAELERLRGENENLHEICNQDRESDEEYDRVVAERDEYHAGALEWNLKVQRVEAERDALKAKITNALDTSYNSGAGYDVAALLRKIREALGDD